MNYFDKAIYWVSASLLIPVMLAVAYFFLDTLFRLWKHYQMYTVRTSYNRTLKIVLKDSKDPGFLTNLSQLPEVADSQLSYGVHELVSVDDSEAAREKSLSEFEIACQKQLDKYRTLSKIGPILGLMGTLIPMGPALAGLAAGDINSMSQHMQVAFNTTVVGLVIGSVGFLLLQTQQRWVSEDLNYLEYINDWISENKNKANEK